MWLIAHRGVHRALRLLDAVTVLSFGDSEFFLREIFAVGFMPSGMLCATPRHYAEYSISRLQLQCCSLEMDVCCVILPSG